MASSSGSKPSRSSTNAAVGATLAGVLAECVKARGGRGSGYTGVRICPSLLVPAVSGMK